MNNLTIEIGKVQHNFDVPQNWLECNHRQLLNALAALRQHNSVHDCAVWLLFALLDVRWWQFRRQWDLLWLSDVEVKECVEVVMPFLAPKEEQTLIITRQLIDSFKYRFKRYYGPSDLLVQCTAAEFAHCEYHYRRYVANPKDIAPLYQLLAVLYRPGKVDARKGDHREAFNEFVCANRAKQLANVHKGYLYYALELYRGAQFALKENFPQLFTGDGSSVSEFRNSWAELIIEVAGDKFGTVEKVQQTAIGDIFMFLRQNKEQYDKMSKKHG